MQVKVMENILSANEELADQNRAYFKEHHVCALNVMAAPGSGKTGVIEKLIETAREEFPFAVIEGDIASCIDAAGWLRSIL
jgi:hydrogenase nickel incorporation protein HypB